MQRFIGLLVLLAATLTGQTVRTAPGAQSIDSTLIALGQRTVTRLAATQQLAENMMALQIAGHQARRPDIVSFTLALTDALVGRSLDSQTATIRQSLVSVVRDPSVSNFSLAQRLQDALTSLHVRDLEVSDVIRKFIAIGEAVRGPDDSPVSDER